jgi:transposase-like protein
MNANESTEQKPGLDDAASEPHPKNWAAVQAKRALRPSKEAILEAIKASNANVSESARRLGVDRATLWRWMHEDEELMTFRNELREEKLDFVENKLWENIEKGYSKDIQFYLRCQGRGRGWIEVTRFEGADGGPIQHQIRTAPEITIDGRLLETEELRELVSLIRKNAIDLSDEELLRLRDLRKKAQPPMIDVTPENRTVENVAIEASKENKGSTDVGRA